MPRIVTATHEMFQFRPVWRAIGACADDAPVWFLQAEHDGIAKVWSDDEVPYCMVQTSDGLKRANFGDWIGKNPNGLFVLPPFNGDVRHNYPEGTPSREIIDFEIWDGTAWVGAEEAQSRIYLVQES